MIFVKNLKFGTSEQAPCSQLIWSTNFSTAQGLKSVFLLMVFTKQRRNAIIMPEYFKLKSSTEALLWNHYQTVRHGGFDCLSRWSISARIAVIFGLQMHWEAIIQTIAQCAAVQTSRFSGGRCMDSHLMQRMKNLKMKRTRRFLRIERTLPILVMKRKKGQR